MALTVQGASAVTPASNLLSVSNQLLQTGLGYFALPGDQTTSLESAREGHERGPRHYELAQCIIRFFREQFRHGTPDRGG